MGRKAPFFIVYDKLERNDYCNMYLAWTLFW